MYKCVKGGIMLSYHEEDNVSLYLSDIELLEDFDSSVQHIKLLSHKDLGKILIINGEIQHVEKWNPFYHESVTHIPMMFLEKPETVLILGGGDLYAAEQVLLYPSVKKVVLCDHDIEVINLTKKYYPHAEKVLGDDRFILVIADAREYIDTCTESFDLIINDAFNLVDHFSRQEDIFQKLYNLLSPKGLCSDLLYRHIFDKHVLRETAEVLFSNKKTVLSLIVVPEYPGILHLLSMWGKTSLLDQGCKESRNLFHKELMNKRVEYFSYFDPRYCSYYLYIPRYIQQIIDNIESD
jgi:spermidine synthase